MSLDELRKAVNAAEDEALRAADPDAERVILRFAARVRVAIAEAEDALTKSGDRPDSAPVVHAGGGVEALGAAGTGEEG